MGPRLTVSIQTVERSTLGTAGFNREIAIVARIKPSADATIALLRGYAYARHVHRGKIRRESGRPHNCFLLWFSLRNHSRIKAEQMPDRAPPLHLSRLPSARRQ